MRKLRRTTKQYIVTVLLSLLIVGSAFLVAYFILLKNIEKKYGLQLSVLSDELSNNQRYVYEALCEIEAGTPITEESLVYKQVYTSQMQDTFIESSDLGKVALISIPEGVFVQKNMVQESGIEDQVREAAYTCIELANHIQENDWIDVRLFYPNGEDYIVLSKKAVKYCSEDHMQCYLWMTEEEILMMSSAIVDAYLYSGAYLYCTKYVEPTIQEASVVNYQASLASQELIRDNPNIVEVAQVALTQNLRKELENRLANSLGTKVEEIEWELSSEKEKMSQQEVEKVNEEHFYYSEEMKAKEEDVEYGE